MYSPYFTNRCKFKNTKNGFTLLYEFPIASVTKDHKCSSLKELHVLFYQCGGHISKWVFRAAFFWKLWQRILSCFFQLLEAAHNLNTQKIKIMASGPITSWEIDGETVETVPDFIFLGSKITADGDCSHETKRRLLLGRKVMTNLDSILKSRDITLPTKVHLVKAMVFQWSYMDVRAGL